MAAPALVESPATNPMAAVRIMNKMRAAGFALSLENSRLMVEPLSRLTEEQRRFIRAHKPALVQLLTDAETVYNALKAAGDAGIGFG